MLTPARFLRNLRLGVRALLRRPLRTTLVLQGVIWGVAISIVPPAILEGSRRLAEADARDQGTDRIVIRAQPTASGTGLDLADLRAVRDDVGGNLRAGGGYRPHRTVAAGRDGRPVSVDVIGAAGDVLAARGQTLDRGRPLTEEDVRIVAPVALLEPGAARLLFGDEDPLGRTVPVGDARLNATELRVVGVVKERSETALATDDLGLDRRHPFTDWLRGALGSWGLLAADDEWKRADVGLIVPLGLVRSEGEPDTLDWMILRSEARDSPGMSVEVERLLAARGKDVEVSINMVWPLLAGRGIDRYLALNKALFLACLVMGGVVIANMMLLAVLERTREVAIRRTEGATRADIVAQFLGEALLMGVVGSLLGIPLGLLLARARVALEPVTVLVVVVPWRAVLISSGLAVVTAVVAGLVPAVRAARLDPVEALRCE